MDLTQTLLLQALGKQPGEGTSTSDVLEPAGDSDSRLNMLLQLLAQRQNEAAQHSEKEEEEEAKQQKNAAVQLAEEQNRVLVDLREKAEQMYQELEVLRTRNDMLAATLGACYLCWGDDVSCPVCGGLGKPGYYMPDRRLFAEFFLPAARRIQPETSGKRPRRARTTATEPSKTKGNQTFERRTR